MKSLGRYCGKCRDKISKKSFSVSVSVFSGHICVLVKAREEEARKQRREEEEEGKEWGSSLEWQQG